MDFPGTAAGSSVQCDDFVADAGGGGNFRAGAAAGGACGVLPGDHARMYLRGRSGGASWRGKLRC
jgi:hypothetical protein